MKSFLKSYVFTGTAIDSSILLGGIFISTIFNIFITIFLTHILDAKAFGLIITAIVFSQMVADIFELGINPAGVKFIAENENSRRKLFIKVTFLLKLGITVITGILVFGFAPLIAEVLFKSSEMIPFVQISAVAIFCLMMISWGQTVFQSQKNFLNSMIANTSMNLFRLIIVGVVITLGITDSVFIYFLLSVVLILSLIFIFLRLGVKFLRIKSDTDSFKQIIVFGLPTGIGFAVAAAYTKLDQILVFQQLGEQSAGVYGLAYRFSLVLLLAATAFNSALVPRFASLKGAEFKAYFKKTLLASLVLSLGAGVVIMISPIIFQLFFRAEYQLALVPFQILSLGLILFVFVSPFNSAILFQFKKTWYSLILAVISLGVIFILLSFLIPSYQINGAAFAVTITYLLQLLLSVSYFWWLSNHD